jgi:hypothetical protein
MEGTTCSALFVSVCYPWKNVLRSLSLRVLTRERAMLSSGKGEAENRMSARGGKFSRPTYLSVKRDSYVLKRLIADQARIATKRMNRFAVLTPARHSQNFELQHDSASAQPDLHVQNSQNSKFRHSQETITGSDFRDKTYCNKQEPNRLTP